MKNSASPRAARCLFLSGHFCQSPWPKQFPQKEKTLLFQHSAPCTQRRPILLSIVTNAIVSSDNVVMALPHKQFTSYAYVYLSC